MLSPCCDLFAFPLTFPCCVVCLPSQCCLLVVVYLPSHCHPLVVICSPSQNVVSLLWSVSALILKMLSSCCGQFALILKMVPLLLSVCLNSQNGSLVCGLFCLLIMVPLLWSVCLLKMVPLCRLFALSMLSSCIAPTGTCYSQYRIALI